MTTAIETYLNSLSDNIPTIDISVEGIKSLPDLTRFKNLKKLICSHNQLTSLPTLPQNLQILICDNNLLTYLPTLPQNLQELYCSYNKLTSLPTLPQNLQILSCYNNKLTSLPTLPQNLKELNCYNNKLTSLPTLPQNLKILYCYNNKFTSLPTLPQNLEIFNCVNNPIYKIVNNDSLFQIKQKIQILNNFRHLYYCLKFKKQLRKWLWEKVREPSAKKLYNPKYLIENLGNEDDLDTVLNNWN
jgi:Leucine-rich repeat (LRR) protein